MNPRCLFHSRHETIGNSARGSKVVEKSDELSNDDVDHGQSDSGRDGSDYANEFEKVELRVAISKDSLHHLLAKR